MGELLRAGEPVILWENDDREATYMWEFLQKVNKKYRLDLKTYDDLHAWSIHNVAEFWGETWDFTGMQSAAPFTKVSCIVHQFSLKCFASRLSCELSSLIFDGCRMSTSVGGIA